MDAPTGRFLCEPCEQAIDAGEHAWLCGRCHRPLQTWQEVAVWYGADGAPPLCAACYIGDRP